MEKNHKMLLGVAVLVAAAYYFLHNSKTSTTKAFAKGKKTYKIDGRVVSEEEFNRVALGKR
jgi:uncharacterized protein YxeA